MKLLSALLLFFASLSLGAQTTFTGHLRAAGQGKGVVVIIQSDEIEQAVNRKQTSSAASGKEAKPSERQTPQKHTAAEQPKASGKNSHTADSTKKTQHAEAGRAGHATESSADHTNSGASRHYTERARRKAQGYRICIYTGGNSRADREKAVMMGNKCRAKFSELASYPNFIAPRWVTYVGDFRTREEAQKYVTRIRKANISYEVRIVKSEVNLPY